MRFCVRVAVNVNSLFCLSLSQIRAIADFRDGETSLPESLLACVPYAADWDRD